MVRQLVVAALLLNIVGKSFAGEFPSQGLREEHNEKLANDQDYANEFYRPQNEREEQRQENIAEYQAEREAEKAEAHEATVEAHKDDKK